MKYTLLLLPTFLCSLAPSLAHAETLNLNSAAGVSYTYASGYGALDGTSGSAAVITAYTGAIAGSDWISTSAAGGDGTLNGVVDYTLSLDLLSNEAYSGNLSYKADDLAEIFVNGVQITSGYGGDRLSTTTISLLSSYFHAGENTVTFADLNSGGGSAGVDFAGTLDGTAVTPEPSSLALLGTGLLSVVGVVRRRFQPAV